MPVQVDPYAFSNAFGAQQQRSAQNRLMAQQQAQQGIENERQNRLLDMQAQTAERNAAVLQQQADFQRTRLGQQDRIADRERTLLGVQRAAAISRKALTFQDPTQRRAFLQRSIPLYADDFRALGADVSDPQKMLAVPDEELLANLRQVAAFGQDEPSGSKIGAFNPGDYEPESFARFQQSNNAADLRRYHAPERTSAEPRYGAPRTGVNPATGQSEYFVADAAGNMKWLGAAGTAGRDAADRTTGKITAQASADMPRVEANAEQMLSVLDQLDRSPLQRIYGAESLIPIIPGTQQADVYALWGQLVGKAFLEAFNTLKGGGQITEVEGEKATAAITRLAQRKISPREAKRAIAELRDIVQTGVATARARADGNRSPDEQQQAAGSADGWSVEVVQ